MARFRRRRSTDLPEEVGDQPIVEEALDGEQAGDAPDAPEEEPEVAPGYDRAGGPFDESESGQADQDLPRLDLGSLRIPGLPGVSVQLEAEEATQQVHAVTAIVGEAAVQLRPFAAPRSEGLWDDLRATTLKEIRATAGARVTDSVGAFGAELRAIVPARTPEGQQIRQPMRFAGVDGPRWFLQVLFLGKAAVEPDPTDALHQLVRETIVVRGTEAMAPGQPLPLTLPTGPQPGFGDDAADHDHTDHAQADDAQTAADGTAAEEESGADTPEGSRYSGIDPYERGPEITEVR